VENRLRRILRSSDLVTGSLKQTEWGGTIRPTRTDDGLGAKAEWYLTVRCAHPTCARLIELASTMVPLPAAVHWDADFAQAATSGLFAALRTRHDADRSVGKVAAFLVLPQ
jgi:hypothetical protein